MSLLLNVITWQVYCMCIDRLKASETGDYSFCFDNSFSQFSTKVVYFELYVANDDEYDSDSDALFANLPDDSDYEINLEHVKVAKPSLCKTSNSLVFMKV